MLPDEKKASAIAFLDRALAWFGRHGVTVPRVMTDNGHIRTLLYTPRTNGKAERFIQ